MYIASNVNSSNKMLIIIWSGSVHQLWLCMSSKHQRRKHTIHFSRCIPAPCRLRTRSATQLLLLGQNESLLIYYIFLWPDISKVQPSIVAGLACLLSLLPGCSWPGWIVERCLGQWSPWKSNALGPKPLPSFLTLSNLSLPWGIQFYICLCQPSHCSA